MRGALDAVEGLRRTQAACVFLADYKLEAHWLRAWRSPGTTLFTRRIARGHTTKSGRRVDFALDVEEFISSGGFGPTMPRSPARWVWPRFPGCPVCDGGSVGVAGTRPFCAAWALLSEEDLLAVPGMDGSQLLVLSFGACSVGWPSFRGRRLL